MVLPNLPNVRDANIQISEHDAIMRYLAKKYKPEMLGKNDSDYALEENLFSFFVKQRIKMITFCYEPDPTIEKKKKFIESMNFELSRLDQQLQGKKFFLGDYLTIADIYFYENLLVLKFLHEETMKKF